VSAVRYLLAHGESLATLGENCDLNGAAFHGHWQLCQFLVEQGADVNHPVPETGETPLHAATCKASRPAYNHVLRVLLAHGADANRATKPGVETGSFMRDCRTRGETPLHRAAAFGTEEAIQLLLEAGARRDARDVNGDSPLTWASWHLRPAAILRKLCYGHYSMHPGANWTSDHGMGWGNGMETHLLGKPHLRPAAAPAAADPGDR
jgi:ankyrin repeat protein